MKAASISFLSLILISLLSLCGCNDNVYPTAHNGIIDVKQYDFDGNSPLPLSGEWEFYYGELIPPDRFKTDAPLVSNSFVLSPSVWNSSVDFRGNKLSGNGCATYRVLVRVPNGQHDWGFKIYNESTSYKLFVNGEMILSNGITSRKRSEAKPQYLPSIGKYNDINARQYNGDGKTLELVMHVSNYKDHNGGMSEPVYLSSYTHTIRHSSHNFMVHVFMAGAIFIIALYHFSFVSFRKRDRASLYFGIFTIIMFLRNIVVGERIIVQIIPSINWEVVNKIEYITAYSSAVFIALFIKEIYREGISPVVIKIIAWCGAAISLFILFSFIPAYSVCKKYFDVYFICSCLVIIGILARLSFKRVESALQTFIGILILCGTALNDLMYHAQIIQSVDLAPLGLFVFIFSESYVITRRMAYAYNKIGSLTMELARKNEELLEVDRIKDEFLANTSHELSTPLNGIIGIVESLIDGVGGGVNAEQKRNLSMVQYSAARLSNLVNDILDFSKIKNSEIVLQRKGVSLYSIVDIILMMSKPLIGNKGIALANKLPGDIPLVYGDENRIQQILQNLVSNAIKFTESGSIIITAEIDNDKVRISVNDTGIGVPEDKRDAIFDSFVQADGSVSRSYGGTGLGLAITKKLVELHGGTIGLRSEMGSGSSFYFTLPLFDEKNMVVDVFQGGKSMIIPSMLVDDENIKEKTNMILDDRSSSKILVVDDDIVNLQVMKNVLSPYKYQIVTVESGEEALDCIEQEEFDLVLLDVMMPRMSGFEVCRIIRETKRPSELPVIMVTAKRLVSDLVAGFDAGANDYLLKPFDKRELLARVGTMIKLREAYQEHESFTVMEQELEIAERVQRDVLTDPESIAEKVIHEIEVAYIPQNGKVGGDYYHLSSIAPGLMTATIADATGHGIQAALTTMQIDILNKQSMSIIDPDERLSFINSFIMREARSRNFFTAFTINIAANEICYSTAGHLPQILLREKTGEVIYLKTKGKMIGLQLNAKYSSKSEKIQKGDLLFLFTDGIYEEFNGKEEYGEEKFKSMLLKLWDEQRKYDKLSRFVEPLIESVKRFKTNARYSDDITLVAIRIC